MLPCLRAGRSIVAAFSVGQGRLRVIGHMAVVGASWIEEAEGAGCFGNMTSQRRSPLQRLAFGMEGLVSLQLRGIGFGHCQ